MSASLVGSEMCIRDRRRRRALRPGLRLRAPSPRTKACRCPGKGCCQKTAPWAWVKTWVTLGAPW
eukprot:2280963-Alexandrium_andersonii.AAC.1